MNKLLGRELFRSFGQQVRFYVFEICSQGFERRTQHLPSLIECGLNYLHKQGLVTI